MTISAVAVAVAVVVAVAAAVVSAVLAVPFVPAGVDAGCGLDCAKIRCPFPSRVFKEAQLPRPTRSSPWVQQLVRRALAMMYFERAELLLV